MSNLLDKASIVTTPTAYNNGKILSVKPSVVLGEELVVNGNFSNGANNWLLGTGWTIGDNKATSDASVNSYLNQTLYTIGNLYKLKFEVLEGVIELRSAQYSKGTGFYTTGIHEIEVIPTTASTYFYVYTGFGQSSITNISVKEAIDGDFDFTRNSSATRVNSQGLIEDMQILSGDLVSNGDFSQEGSDLVVNGDFATDSNWTNSDINGFSISGGKLNLSNVAYAKNTSQSNVTTVGKTYKVTFEISDYVKGSVRIFLGGTVTPTQASNGVFTSYVTVSANTTIGVQTLDGGGTTLSIDNVSVKEVGQDWTISSSASVGENKLNVDASAFDFFAIQTALTNGLTYKVTLDAEVTTGDILLYTGTQFATINSSDSYTFYITSDSAQIRFRSGGSGFIGSITNIKIIEITSDTNLPRIDYTGGVGHWLFEPQSTNLIPYSEDFSQWSKVNGVVVISNSSISPNGTQNASKVIYNGTPSSRLETSTSASGTNTQSIYLKTDSGTQAVSIGSSTSGITEVIVTSQWKRFTYTGTGSYPRVLCNDAATIYIWGAQFEASSFATSYIPTNGSTVTRLQDAAFGAGSSDLINSTEGVLYAEIAALANGGVGDRYISLGSGSDVTNTVQLLYHNTANRINFRVTKGGSFQVNISDFTFEQTENLKIAVKFKANDFALWINGVERVTDTSGQTFDVGTLQKLQFDSGNRASDFFGKIKCLAVFKEALTDAELTCLTTI